ncbi:MAG TPA: tol-pal system protein YbgF, partial [Marinagarivorans sp.]
ARPASGSATSNAVTVDDGAAGSAEDELILYRTGIDAVLKQRDYDQGIVSFGRYLEQYPNGVYAANAKYWLGQVYLQREELDSAKNWFSELVNEYPNHQKTAEAKFKLAKVLYMQGETEKAKQQLQSVAASGSSAAKLAQAFLDKNY